MPAGKLLVEILTGVTVFTGEDGGEEEAEFVPELHPMINESDRSGAKINTSKNVGAFRVLRAALMLRNVNPLMNLLMVLFNCW